MTARQRDVVVAAANLFDAERRAVGWQDKAHALRRMRRATDNAPTMTAEEYRDAVEVGRVLGDYLADLRARREGRRER